jgi:hypothetical protein
LSEKNQKIIDIIKYNKLQIIGKRLSGGVMGDL